MPCRFPGPLPRGKFRGIWSPGPHLRRKLRGIWQGGACSWGVPAPGGLPALGEGACSGGVPAPRGKVPALGVVVLVVETPLPADGYCCGRYVSYWNAFLWKLYSTQAQSFACVLCRNTPLFIGPLTLYGHFTGFLRKIYGI